MTILNKALCGVVCRRKNYRKNQQITRTAVLPAPLPFCDKINRWVIRQKIWYMSIEYCRHWLRRPKAEDRVCHFFRFGFRFFFWEPPKPTLYTILNVNCYCDILLFSHGSIVIKICISMTQGVWGGTHTSNGLARSTTWTVHGPDHHWLLGLHQVLHVPMTWPPPVTCKANALFNVQIRWNNLCNLFYCYSLFINFYCLDKTHWQKIRRRMFSSWALIPDQWKPLWFDHFVFDYKKPDMGLIQNLICDYFLFTFIIWLHVGFIFFWWQFKLCWKDAK